MGVAVALVSLMEALMQVLALVLGVEVPIPFRGMTAPTTHVGDFKEAIPNRRVESVVALMPCQL